MRAGLARHRRTLLTAAATGAVLVATVQTAPARGQEPPSGTTTAAAPVGIANAFAAAEVFSLAPTAGSLAFAMSTGSALAETTGALAQSKAQAANLGLIGSSLSAEQCDGSDGAVKPEDLPQPTQVDNRGGDTSQTSTEAPLIPQFGFGYEEASATQQPSSRAVSTTGDIDLAPVLRVDGGRAVAESEVVDGVRQGASTVDLSLDLLEGAIRIDSMRWTARHQTGARDDIGGAFTIGALELLGVPVPGDELAPAIEAVNDLLAPSGMRMELPRVERLEEPVDLIRVTPLRLVIEDSEIGGSVVRPGLDASRDVRSQLFDALTAIDCSFASLLLVGEIGVGIASGTGALVIELGGVEARSSEVFAEDAFGGVLPLPDVVGEVIDQLAPGGGVPAGVPAVAGPPPPASTGSATIGNRTATPISGERSCESTHPFGWPGCSEGAAGVVGAVGLVATAGAAVLDFRRRRPVAGQATA